MKSMTRQLFDLCGSDPRIRFSPFCWRTKMALMHKGLEFDTVAWRFTEKDAISDSGQGRVPVLIDGGKLVNDSWTIAEYLDATYPEKPLMKDEAAVASARFYQGWANGVLFAPLRPIAIMPVYDMLSEPDSTYFRESREKMLGMSLEDYCTEARVAAAYDELAKLLKPLDGVLSDHAYLGGAEPFLGDYIIFGTLMWAHIVRPDHKLPEGTATAAWFERLLDMHDGYARKAPRAA
jgi:glutathione S-transferase